MAIGVADAGADHRQAWAQGLEQWLAGGRRAAVMGDLEQVPAVVAPGEGLEQVGVVVVLGVSGEQDVLLTDVDREHDGGAVDGTPIG